MPLLGEDPSLDAETRKPVVLGTAIAFVVASVTAVLLRLYTRVILIKTPGVDDVLITLAVVLSIGVSVSNIVQAELGLGRHVWTEDAENMMKQLKALFAGMICYNTSQILTKLSFLMLYRRIFMDNLTRGICMWLLIGLGTWGIAQDILVGMSCTPVADFDPSRKDSCVDGLTVWYLTSITNVVTDFIVFLVPVMSVRKLQLARKKKILVVSLFGLGVFTCAISIVRLFTLNFAINTTDPTWDSVPAAYWTVVELNCAIIIACLPTLRPLIFYQQSQTESTDQPSNSIRPSYAKGAKTRSEYSNILQNIEAGESQLRLKDGYSPLAYPQLPERRYSGFSIAMYKNEPADDAGCGGSNPSIDVPLVKGNTYAAARSRTEIQITTEIIIEESQAGKSGEHHEMKPRA